MVSLFGVPLGNYYDDFPVITPDAIQEATSKAIEAIQHICGWKWKGGDKDMLFASRFQLLVVHVDLTEVLCRGSLRISNTQKRSAELSAIIEGALSSARLLPREAESLVGRLAFASSQTFGRVGAAALRPLRAHAHALGGSALVTWDVSSALH